MIYGYLRVSTDEQDSNNQKLGVCKKAESLGLSVDDWLIDCRLIDCRYFVNRGKVTDIKTEKEE